MTGIAIDKGTAQKIKLTAVGLFGEQDFSVTVKTIAEAAGVSPGLVIHHFGTKENLRAACDEHAFSVIKETRHDILSGDGIAFLQKILQLHEYASVVAYILTSLEAGGPLARHFLQVITDDAQEDLDEAVIDGRVRASQYPRERTEWLTFTTIGSLLLYRRLHRDKSTKEMLEDHIQRYALPRAELYTYGLYTNPEIYNSVVQEFAAETAPEFTSEP